MQTGWRGKGRLRRTRRRRRRRKEKEREKEDGYNINHVVAFDAVDTIRSFSRVEWLIDLQSEAAKSPSNEILFKCQMGILPEAQLHSVPSNRLDSDQTGQRRESQRQESWRLIHRSSLISRLGVVEKIPIRPSSFTRL